MNIISNACLGGWYYKHLNLPYENPFIWTRISNEQYVDMCRDYDKINFKNITSKKLDWVRCDSARKWKVPWFTIDNQFQLEWVHYRQDDSQKTILRKDPDVYGNNMLQYATDTYFKRLERMHNNQPIFLFYYHTFIPTSTRTIDDFLSFDSPYERYIVTYDISAIEHILQMKNVDLDKIAFFNVGNDQIKLASLSEKKFQLKHKYCPVDSDSVLENKKPVEKLNRCIWQFWTDGTPMSDSRKLSLATGKNLSIKQQLLFPADIMKYQVKEHPFHRAYPFLSATHKSDYLRCYFMHFYGGGYADIKQYTPENNWKQCFDAIDSSPDTWMIGQKEIMNGSGIREYNTPEIIRYLIANGWFICRPHTEFTQKWLDCVEKRLDGCFVQLKSCWNETKKDPQICNQKNKNYPLRWSEILGDILHQLEYEFRNSGHISNMLISGWDSTKKYR